MWRAQKRPIRILQSVPSAKAREQEATHRRVRPIGTGASGWDYHTCTGEPPKRCIQCLLSSADSTGRRNKLMKSLGWCLEIQCLPRPFVKPPSYRVELGLRVG